jgi:AcrR family transcriptional regulator
MKENSEMLDGPTTLSSTRSDQRIPKLRSRGRANRQKLLDEAQHLIEVNSGRPIRFSDVFESAGVSRGSAYRIYNGVEDLLQDLASFWINNFVAFIRDAEPMNQPDSWSQLSDQLVARAASYWVETADTLRVLPRVRSNVPESYRAAVKDLTKAFADTFDYHFEMPVIADWLATLAMYTSLGDTIFSDAVRREGYISEQRLMEAQKICNTYLSFYLPTWIPPKNHNQQ